MTKVKLTAVTGATAHSQGKYEYKMIHRTNIAQNAHLSKTVENARSLKIKQGSPKPKAQLAHTVGTGKGTAVLLTCPLNERQCFEDEGYVIFV